MPTRRRCKKAVQRNATIETENKSYTQGTFCQKGSAQKGHKSSKQKGRNQIMEYVNITEQGTKQNTTYRTKHKAEQIRKYVNTTERGTELNITYRTEHKINQISEHVNMAEHGRNRRDRYVNRSDRYRPPRRVI